MPYKSEKQRRLMHAKHPDIAARWDREYGTKVKKSAWEVVHKLDQADVHVMGADSAKHRRSENGKRRLRKVVTKIPKSAIPDANGRYVRGVQSAGKRYFDARDRLRGR